MKFLKKRWGETIVSAFTLTPQTKDMLDIIAEKENLNKSEIVRQLIEHQYTTGNYPKEVG